MGRLPRIQFEGAFYHVFSRGNRREATFLDDLDYRMFEDILLDQAFRAEINLSAWCPMPNHFHLALETPKANLAVFMQNLLTPYARYFNQKYRKVGHVFQGRYGSRLVDREEYLLELVRYIHLNPYRVKNPHWTIPEDGWPWSSDRFYIGGQEPAAAAPSIHAVLRRFGNTPDVARQRYAEFIAQGLAGQCWQNFYQVKERRFIGRDAWVREIKEKLAEPDTLSPLPHWPGDAILLAAVAQETNVSSERLRAGARDQDIARARQVFAYMAVRLWHQRQSDVAKVLRKDASSVSHLLRSCTIARAHPLVQRVLVRIASSINCG